MITILRRGVGPKYHIGGGSLGTPKSVYVIYVRPHRNTKENTPLPAWPTPYFSIDYHNLGGDRHQKFINGVRSKHEIYIRKCTNFFKPT